MPAWLLVLAYVGWNIYDWLVYGQESSVNVIVHIAGACFGYLLAVSVFRASKQRYLATSTVRDVNRKYALATR